MQKRILLMLLFAAVLLAAAAALICYGRPKAAEQTAAVKPIKEEVQTQVYLQSLDEKTAGDVLAKEEISESNTDAYFTAQPIDDALFERIYGLSYKDYCTLPREDLCYLKVLHYNFNHEIQVGEMIVNTEIKDDCLDIFKQLYLNEYEIEKMYLIDNYNADDDASMGDNNSSAFNYRKIANSERLSNHSYGKAVDINPVQNPYIYTYNGKEICAPENAAQYIDRTQYANSHIIDADDLCFKLFIQHGFTWGGDWDTRKDYQHFEKE